MKPFGGAVLVFVLAVAVASGGRLSVATAMTFDGPPAEPEPTEATGPFDIPTTSSDSIAAASPSEAASEASDRTSPESTSDSGGGSAPETQPSIGYPILFGVLGGAAGLLAGGFIGADSADDSELFPSAALWGAMAGESALLALGVHLGNGRRGNFLADLAVSALIGAAATGVALAIDDDPESGIAFAAGLAIQVGGTVVVERHFRSRP